MPRLYRRTFRERGLRLRGHDYASPGWYFVTIVTAGRRNVFGTIVDGTMQLSPLGEIVKAAWLSIPTAFPGVRLGMFVIMPNHVHGLLELPCSTVEAPPKHRRGAASGSLGAIVGGFKATVSRWASLGRGALWEQRFHDRVVRDEDELAAIEAYIEANPRRWRFDARNDGSDVPIEERDCDDARPPLLSEGSTDQPLLSEGATRATQP